jgi:glycosyltransferase involved in cell wall biosynthesis
MPSDQPNAHPLRVLLLTDSDEFAGTEQHMLDLAAALRIEGTEVSIGCPDPSILGPRAKAIGLQHTVVQKGKLLDRPAIATLKQLLTARALDVIHAHNGRTALSAMLAVRAAKRGRSVLTHHFIHPHHSTLRGLKGWLIHRAHRSVNHRINAHIAISNAVRAAAVARHDVAEKSIYTVLNGIADPADKTSEPRNAIRASLGIGSDSPLILCLARLEPEKNVDYLLRAMQQVMAMQPDAICVIAGEGSKRAMLESLAAKLGVTDRVRMVGFHRDPASLMQAADVIVLPSAMEPFGLAIVEAMALGKPVIAAKAGGPMEIVVDGTTGLLVDTANESEFASAIVRFTSDPALRYSMGREARQRFESHFTRKRMAAETQGIYQSVLAV